MRKEMFISRRVPLTSFGDNASPAIITWRRLNPYYKGAQTPYRMKRLASNCGHTHVDLTVTVKSELGFDVCGLNSLQIQ
jgi:hypothetical protein